jgi:acyl-homoserine-lactone acylase
VTSKEGLNVYGAATWGQFFIYQGFNAKAGWMHTSSGVDNVDEFAKTVELRGGKRMYLHGPTWVEGRQAACHHSLPDGQRADGGTAVHDTAHAPWTAGSK